MNNVLQFKGPARTHGGGSLTGLPPQPDNQSGDQQGNMQSPNIPAPSHAEAVTALRHFAAFMRVERKWLANPELGRSDLRDTFINGYTGLVADRVATPTQVVETLATAPDKPAAQKKWVLENYQRNIQARDFIIAHHAATYAGMGPQEAPDPDQHLAFINSMMSSHYPGQTQ
jgi:hypothetical protein